MFSRRAKVRLAYSNTIKDGIFMDVGISTACFYPSRTEDAIDTIFGLGFKKIEYFINSEYEYDVNFTREQKKKLDALGIEVRTVHSYTTAFEHYLLFSTYERRRNEGQRIFRDVINAASILGAKYVTFHGITKFMSSVPDQVCLKVYNELINIARKYGITISQENVSYCRSIDVNHIKLLKSEFTPEELMFTLDIKQAVRGGKNVYDFIDAMSGRIANIHINDHNEQSPCLLPGAAGFDYLQFFHAIRNTGYNETCTIEVYRQNYGTVSEVKDSKIFLENLLSEISGI